MDFGKYSGETATRVPLADPATIDHAMRAWDELDVGGVLINEMPSWRVDNMPYGGVKESGIGREGVRYAMEDMTEIRTLIIRDRPSQETM